MKSLLATSFDRAWWFTIGFISGTHIFVEVDVPWHRYITFLLFNFALIFAVSWIINKVFGD